MTQEEFDKLSTDDIVIHAKYNREYRVRDKHLLAKNPTTDEWVESVTYVPLYDNPEKLFCRAKDSFLKEFLKKKSMSGQAIDILFRKCGTGLKANMRPVRLEELTEAQRLYVERINERNKVLSQEWKNHPCYTSDAEWFEYYLNNSPIACLFKQCLKDPKLVNNKKPLQL